MRTLDDVRLTDNERRAIEAAVAVLHAGFPVTDIVLYGSKASGDSDPESDIDLLVLTSRPLDYPERQRLWSDLHDISMRFDVLLSPLTVDARSWREGVHSVLPIHTEVEREGVRYLDRAAEPPPDPRPPPADEVPSSTPSREAFVKQVVDEWMRMAEEALASARADADAQRRRSASRLLRRLLRGLGRAAQQRPPLRQACRRTDGAPPRSRPHRSARSGARSSV